MKIETALHVARFELTKSAKCFVEIDEYVPLRFRISDFPLGSVCMRLGDQCKTLLELLVDADGGLLHGITVTSIDRLAEWPRMEVRESSRGLPVFEIAWENKRWFDVGTAFSVAVHSDEILVFWGDLTHCDAASFYDRVDFLTVSRRLTGVKFRKLSPAEMKTFVAHGNQPDSV